MSRLKTLKPRLQPAKLTRLASIPTRIDATPRQRGRGWMERRAKWLRAYPLCCHCDAEGRTTLAEEVDHIIPLWKRGLDDESNFQSLCKPHHEAKTAEEAKERAALGIA